MSRLALAARAVHGAGEALANLVPLLEGFPSGDVNLDEERPGAARVLGDERDQLAERCAQPEAPAGLGFGRSEQRPAEPLDPRLVGRGVAPRLAREVAVELDPVATVGVGSVFAGQLRNGDGGGPSARRRGLRGG